MQDKERKYIYWLAALEGIRTKEKKQLLERFGNARELYYIEERHLEQEMGFSDDLIRQWRKGKQWDLDRKQDELDKVGIRIVLYRDAEYPGRLRQLEGMPFALYVRGKMPEEKLPSAAIVGARQCTAYGENMAHQYGEKLARAGVQIISGMARGIDGAAQRGALCGKGRTYAVLGCGPDVCYPRENRGLFQDLLKTGGILSEYPPGTMPLPRHFPARNRIISGLSDAVLVMEAKAKSGSLITADQALEQGKDVCALPGAADSPYSLGCHMLIRQGAEILLSPEEFLEGRKGIWSLEGTEEGIKNKIMLEKKEELVYSKLALYPKSKEELLAETGLEPSEISAALVSLELKGYIAEKSKNYYFRQI